jgi:regulatory protein
MDEAHLKEMVLKFLSFRARSVAEVTKYLHSKTSDPDLINQTLDYLKKYRLVDDAAFARWLVESRSRSRPRGSRLLRQELKSKGIDPSTIDQNLTPVDERELALSALSPKLARWQSLSFRDFRIKAARFLQIRGFPWGVIEETIKKAYNQSHVN